MHRLLQGDVGSGKTVVALAALLVAVQGGHQGAFMAPTEVLAEQHYLSVRALLEGVAVPDTARSGGERPLAVALLTNRTSAGDRARLHEGLRHGSVDLVVGTHALLTDDVRFRRPRRGGHRRAAPLRGGATRRAAGQGPRTRRKVKGLTPTCSS